MHYRYLLLATVSLVAAGIFVAAWRPAERAASSDGGSSPRSSLSVGGTTSPDNSSSKRAPVSDPWFATVTPRTGIDFSHCSGTGPEKPFPAANGSGLAALDYDLDGYQDLYFATGIPFPLDPDGRHPTNRLYRNRGGLRFEDASAASGLDHYGYSAGVTVGDVDADGFPDVYIACYGENVLLRNQGDGTFEPLRDAGVGDRRWATSACMLDYDNDGLLDLYVCNYARWTWESNQFCGDRARGIRIHCSPHAVPPEADLLYRNRGDGTFEEVTDAVGLGGRPGRAQGVVAADVDGNGAVDLYVGNDLHANSLFLNQGDGTFEDASERSGVAYDFEGNRQAGMGVAAGDTNGDGRLELLVTNFQSEHNAFYENLGGGLFADVANSRGLAAESLPWVGWGTALVDFNLDGRLDVIVTNGHVDDNLHLLGQTAPYAAPPLLWKNIGGRFEFLGRRAGAYFEQAHVGRGLVVADLDNDGDEDVVVGHQDAAPAVLRNERLPGGTTEDSAPAASLTLRLVGTRSNRDGIGTRLVLHAGRRRAARQVTHGGSYLSRHDPRQVFAVLDGEQESLELTLRWPSGAESTLTGLRTGRQYVVIEPLDETSPTRLISWGTSP